MDIKINSKKYNKALHHITKTITVLQEIRTEFLEAIKINGEDEPNTKEKDNV